MPQTNEKSFDKMFDKSISNVLEILLTNLINKTVIPCIKTSTMFAHIAKTGKTDKFLLK